MLRVYPADGLSSFQDLLAFGVLVMPSPDLLVRVPGKKVEEGLRLTEIPIAWPLLVNFGCPSGSTPANCSRSENMGWRYLYIIIGGVCLIMAFARALVLGTRESPRWLTSCGRVEETVVVLNAISATNKTDYRVDISQFVQTAQGSKTTQSFVENVKRAAQLFAGPRKLRLMICLIGIWLLIGIA